jgi:cyclopropane-fatty-acyl-phospholipid synthase
MAEISVIESEPVSAQAPDGPSVAAVMTPLLNLLFSGAPPVQFDYWDGSSSDPVHRVGEGRVTLRSPDALRWFMWSPNLLGLGRAYVAGAIDFDGDAIEVLRALRFSAPSGPTMVRVAGQAVRAAVALGVVGAPLRPPSEELRPRGRLHSRRRDSRSISHHYDVGNAFYHLVLGPSMTYSCARWGGDAETVDDAQVAKHDLICRKLGLDSRPGMRLLDVGCGWGSMALHAAARYQASVVGITISEQQVERATERVKEAELADHVDIRLQDYRELGGEQFDAISSIGMFEHVGIDRTAEYFHTLRGLLRPKGRLLNHAISVDGHVRSTPRTFMGRYVFPDSELMDVADVVRAMESAGFEVRDVESLREHYALTLRAWIHALEQNWDAAVREVGEARARVWRAYMAGSVLGFEEGHLAVHQVLGVIPDEAGASGMPLRPAW